MTATTIDVNRALARMSQAHAFDALIAELIECYQGRRGWVSLKLDRCRAAGLDLAAARTAAACLDLAVRRHGKYGWGAYKPEPTTTSTGA